MTHEEYLSRLSTFTDSPEEVQKVLSHANACAQCRKDQRRMEAALSRLEPKQRSLAEQIVRWGLTAAVLVVIVVGLQRPPDRPAKPAAPVRQARYRIVGDSSGVVAYTPSGIVVGTVAQAQSSKAQAER